jgi:hypothetical protein
MFYPILILYTLKVKQSAITADEVSPRRNLIYL